MKKANCNYSLKGASVRTIFLILLIFSSLSIPKPGLAESIKLITGDWPPYCSSNPKEPGITTEIVLAAFAAVKVKTELNFYPWARCKKMVQHAMDVAAFPYVKTPRREKYALFSTSILTERTYLYYSKKNMHKFDFTNYEDLKKYRIGTLNGFVHQEIFEENNVPAITVANNKNALSMLLRNRIQLFPMNDLVAKQEIHKNFADKIHELTHTKTPMYKVDLHLMVSKDTPRAKHILELFAKGLAIIRANGTFAKIIEKYN